MNYEEMSDFEINNYVHNYVKNIGCNLVLDGNGGVIWVFSDGARILPDFDGYRDGGLKDYCNNPADMWPIILQNNIVITPCMGSNIGDATGYSEHVNPVLSEFSTNDRALRSAAIVFLMMKDAENAK